MKALTRGYVWWPNMNKVLKKAVNSCSQCQLQQKAPKEAPLYRWQWPGQPPSRLHIDYAGPNKPNKGHVYLVVIDVHIKWMDVHIMKSTSSPATIEKLREIFTTHGLPDDIVNNNGSSFTSAGIRGFPSAE